MTLPLFPLYDPFLTPTTVIASLVVAWQATLTTRGVLETDEFGNRPINRSENEAKSDKVPLSHRVDRANYAKFRR